MLGGVEGANQRRIGMTSEFRLVRVGRRQESLRSELVRRESACKGKGAGVGVQ